MSFVGRRTEIDLLQREVALALELSSGRSVFVQGSAGTGKSTLVREFLDRVLEARPGVRVARGRCLQTFGSADPYLPFVEALRDLSDESTAGFVRRETLSEMIAELTPYWLSAIPMVGGILSAGFATARRLGGNAASDAAPSREALFVQYLELIQRLASDAPLILCLEDLHWADQSSIALLNHVSRGITTQPVLIIGTLRADDASREKHAVVELIRELERESIGKALKLADFDGEALDALLVCEFGGDVSEPLLRWVRETAGGNPLFASELVKLLKESGGAVERLGEWHLTDVIAELPVPRSAEAVIESRIQALDPEEVKLLQYASVQGNDFDSIVLAGMLEEDELDLIERLERIEKSYQLVVTTGEVDLPDGEIATAYQFRHALVQTVLARQVLGKRRVLLHRKAGEILEKIFGDATESVAGKLARHYDSGRVGERAYRYGWLAAEGARRAYAHWEAEESYRIALTHAPGPAESILVHERLGDVYQTVGYYEQAREAFEAAFALGPAERRDVVRFKRKLATLDRRVGRLPATELLQKLRSLIEEADGVEEERAHLLLELGFLPNAVGVVESATEAVAIGDALGDTFLLAKALEQLAVAMIFGGQPREALPHLERAFTSGGGSADPLRMLRYHNIRGIAHAKLGEYRNALHSFEQLLAVAEKLSASQFIGAACSNLGGQLLMLGEYARAEEVLQRAFTIHQRRDRASMVHSLFNLAKRAHWSGDLELGLERYTALLELSRELEYWTSEAKAAAGRGLCLLEMGRTEEARAAAVEVVAVIADREQWFEDREFIEILLAKLEALDGSPGAGALRLATAAESLANSDLFAFTHVALERIRILSGYEPESARAELANLEERTSGMELGLEGEISRLKAVLELAEVAPDALA